MEEENAEYRLESLRWLALIDEPPSCGEEIILGGGGLVENESLYSDVLSPFQPPDFRPPPLCSVDLNLKISGIESKNFWIELLIELL